jgi:hypothetical protein
MRCFRAQGKNDDGVHKKSLHASLAMGDHKINLKRISPQFLAQLAAHHKSVP